MRWELFGGIRATEFTSVAYDGLNDIIFGGTQDNASIQQQSPGNWQWEGVHGSDGGTAAVEVTPNKSYRYTTGNTWGDFKRTEYDANNNASPLKTLTLAWQNISNGYLSGLTDPASRKPPAVAYFAYLTSPYLSDPSAPWPLAMNIGSHTYESLDRGDTITDVSPGGFTVYQYASNGTIDSLDDVDTLLKTSSASAINYSDTPGAAAGHFNTDVAFPGGNDDDFVLHATAMLDVAPGQEGFWTFGINSDDGSRLLIDGRQVIKDDSIHAAQDTFGTYYLSRGPHELDLVYFDHLGSASIELFAASDVHASFNSNFSLVTSAVSPGLRVTPAGFSVQQLVSNEGVFDLGDVDDLLAP